jgi:hypothetical protein
MTRHDDESNTACFELEEFFGQNSEQDSLGLIVIEQPTAVITRECDEVNIQGIIDPTELAHAGDFPNRPAVRPASCCPATQTSKAMSGPPRRDRLLHPPRWTTEFVLATSGLSGSRSRPSLFKKRSLRRPRYRSAIPQRTPAKPVQNDQLTSGKPSSTVLTSTIRQ